MDSPQGMSSIARRAANSKRNLLFFMSTSFFWLFSLISISIHFIVYLPLLIYSYSLITIHKSSPSCNCNIFHTNNSKNISRSHQHLMYQNSPYFRSRKPIVMKYFIYFTFFLIIIQRPLEYSIQILSPKNALWQRYISIAIYISTNISSFTILTFYFLKLWLYYFQINIQKARSNQFWESIYYQSQYSNWYLQHTNTFGSPLYCIRILLIFIVLFPTIFLLFLQYFVPPTILDYHLLVYLFLLLLIIFCIILVMKEIRTDMLAIRFELKYDFICITSVFIIICLLIFLSTYILSFVYLEITIVLGMVGCLTPYVWYRRYLMIESMSHSIRYEISRSKSLKSKSQTASQVKDSPGSKIRQWMSNYTNKNNETELADMSGILSSELTHASSLPTSHNHWRSLRFEDVICDDEGFRKFIQFLVKTMSSENMLFIAEVMRFKNYLWQRGLVCKEEIGYYVDLPAEVIDYHWYIPRVYRTRKRKSVSTVKRRMSLSFRKLNTFGRSMQSVSPAAHKEDGIIQAFRKYTNRKDAETEQKLPGLERISSSKALTNILTHMIIRPSTSVASSQMTHRPIKSGEQLSMHSQDADFVAFKKEMMIKSRSTPAKAKKYSPEMIATSVDMSETYDISVSNDNYSIIHKDNSVEPPLNKHNKRIQWMDQQKKRRHSTHSASPPEHSLNSDENPTLKKRNSVPVQFQTKRIKNRTSKHLQFKKLNSNTATEMNGNLLQLNPVVDYYSTGNITEDDYYTSMDENLSDMDIVLEGNKQQKVLSLTAFSASAPDAKCIQTPPPMETSPTSSPKPSHLMIYNMETEDSISSSKQWETQSLNMHTLKLNLNASSVLKKKNSSGAVSVPTHIVSSPVINSTAQLLLNVGRNNSQNSVFGNRLSSTVGKKSFIDDYFWDMKASEINSILLTPLEECHRIRDRYMAVGGEYEVNVSGPVRKSTLKYFNNDPCDVNWKEKMRVAEEIAADGRTKKRIPSDEKTRDTNLSTEHLKSGIDPCEIITRFDDACHSIIIQLLLRKFNHFRRQNTDFLQTFAKKNMKSRRKILWHRKEHKAQLSSLSLRNINTHTIVSSIHSASHPMLTPTSNGRLTPHTATAIQTPTLKSILSLKTMSNVITTEYSHTFSTAAAANSHLVMNQSSLQLNSSNISALSNLPNINSETAVNGNSNKNISIDVCDSSVRPASSSDEQQITPAFGPVTKHYTFNTDTLIILDSKLNKIPYAENVQNLSTLKEDVYDDGNKRVIIEEENENSIIIHVENDEKLSDIECKSNFVKSDLKCLRVETHHNGDNVDVNNNRIVGGNHQIYNSGSSTLQSHIQFSNTLDMNITPSVGITPLSTVGMTNNVDRYRTANSSFVRLTPLSPVSPSSPVSAICEKMGTDANISVNMSMVMDERLEDIHVVDESKVEEEDINVDENMELQVKGKRDSANSTHL